MGTKSNPGQYDGYGKAEPDETLFTLLARDSDAPFLIEAWAAMRQARGDNPAQVSEARACAKAMRRWRKLNVPGRVVTVPDNLKEGQGRRAWLLASSLASGATVPDALAQAATAERWIAGLLIDPARELSDRGPAGTGDPGPVRAPPSVEKRRIIDAVCLATGYSIEEIVGAGRAKRLAQARHLAILLVRHRVGASLIQIGEWFNKDHTTAIHALRVCGERLEEDADYLSLHDKVVELLDGPPAPVVTVASPAQTEVAKPERKRRGGGYGYSDGELATLRQGYETGRPVKNIAEAIGRTEGSVCGKARVLGLKHPNPGGQRSPNWTEHMVAQLRDGWGSTKTTDELAEDIGLSPYLIRRKAFELKLPARPRAVGKRAKSPVKTADPWTTERLSQLRSGWEGRVALKRLVSVIGLPQADIQAKASELHLKRPAQAGHRINGVLGRRNARKSSGSNPALPKAPTKTTRKARKRAPRRKTDSTTSEPAPLTERESALLRVFIHRPTASDQTLADDVGMRVPVVRGLLLSLTRKKYLAHMGRGVRTAIRLPDGRPIPEASTGDDETLIANFIAKNGVTKCPTVVVELPTNFGHREGFL